VFFGVSVATRDLVAQAMGQLLAHGYLITHPLAGLTNIDPDLRVPTVWSPMLTACALLLAALVAAMLLARRRQPWLAFAIGWYFMNLAPSNSLLPRLDLANDRHLYLALAGPMLVLACVLAHLVTRKRVRALAYAAAFALCAASALATVRRNTDYRSETALWQATVRDSPGKARAWLNLGYAYRLDGDLARAADAYRCALMLEPTNAQAAIDLDLVAPGDVAPAACVGLD
jgi:tetratricopeptide (TPR) repeat protein